MTKPNEDRIYEFLEHLFEDARTQYPGGLIELRYGKASDLSNHALFGNNEKQIREAANFAAQLNAEGHNFYVGVIRASHRPEASPRMLMLRWRSGSSQI